MEEEVYIKKIMEIIGMKKIKRMIIMSKQHMLEEEIHLCI